MTRIVDLERNITTVAELINALQRMTAPQEQDLTYIKTANGDTLRLELQEEKLTDGSYVYNLVVSDGINKANY